MATYGGKKSRKLAKSGTRHLKSRKKHIRKTQNKLIPKTGIWNKGLNFKTNIQNMGLLTDLNTKLVDNLNKVSRVKDANINIEEEVDLVSLQKGTFNLEKNVEFKKSKINMSLDEKWAIEGLEKQYGDNFKKMFRDIKLNKYQWTVDQCTKHYDNYLDLYGPFKH